MRSTIVLCFLVVLAPRCPAAAPPPALLTEGQIHKLIDQLGSDNFKKREEATRQLRHRDEAEPALRRALASSDLELIQRARSILATLERRHLSRALGYIRADGAAGRADLLAERLVRWQGRDDEDACWQAVLDLGHKLRALDRAKYQRIRHERLDDYYFPGTALRPYMVKNSVRVLPAGRPTVVMRKPKPRADPTLVALLRAEQVLIEHSVIFSLVATSGLARFSGRHGVACSILVSGGSVEMVGGGPLVVVCDGDFLSKLGIGDAVIVARGALRCKGQMKGCLVFAGGDVSFSEDARVESSTVLAAGSISLPTKGKGEVTNCVLKGGVRNALALAPVKFFETASVGVEVVPSRYGVRVSAATPGKAFAIAGLRVDDLVVCLDGTSVRSPAAFRRLLRRRLVVGGPALLEVRREGKHIEVRVPAVR